MTPGLEPLSFSKQEKKKSMRKGRITFVDMICFAL